jgi:hypothetical protein
LYGSVARHIPDDLVERYLGRSGFNCPDLRLWVQIVAPIFSLESVISLNTVFWLAAQESLKLK